MLNFKSKYPIGIDIGSQNIYAVQLKQTRQGFAVRALAHRELEKEIKLGISVVNTTDVTTWL